MNNSLRTGLLFCGIALLGICGAWFFFLRPIPEKHAGNHNATGEPGFKESAQAANLHFSMAFLPKEQGEKFKINLYDHGCGVAVADYDGDGHEDIYFLNQLGPNAL